MMRRLFPVFCCLLALPLLAAEPVAFVNVNVVPMSSDTVLVQQTVVVRDGVIDTIGPVDTVPIPEDVQVVDGTDRYLVPGLAEMHAHVPEVGTSELDRYFALYVANGVTTIRGMLGRESHLGLRRDLRDAKVFGPRLVTSGPSLNGRSVTGVQDAKRQVEEQHAAGFDFIKIHPGLKADQFDALADAANALHMPFAGHVTVAAGVPRVLEKGMATIDHLDGYFAALLPPANQGRGGFGGFFDVMLANEIDASGMADIARETAEAGTWNVPTEILVELMINDIPVAELRSRPEMRYMPKETVRRWESAKTAMVSDPAFRADVAARAIDLRRQLILELHKAGAGLLLGSDSPQVFNVPGFSIHRELEALVLAGLTPYEALRTGTVAVAEFLSSNTGLVEAGRDADLVLLDANPLVDIGNSRRIHGVMLRGAWYGPSELAALLDSWHRSDN